MSSEVVSYEEEFAQLSRSHPKRLHAYVRSKIINRPSAWPFHVDGSLTDKPLVMSESLSVAFASFFIHAPLPDIFPHQTCDVSLASL